MLRHPIDIQEMIYHGNMGEAPLSSKKKKSKQGKSYIIAPKKAEPGNRINRMAKSIKHLALLTNVAHLKTYNLRKQLEIKTGVKLHGLVTRLVMNEFSLYTKDTPLSLEEYKALIANINEIAVDLSPDIHLLIATVPVIWADHKIHNCALYVQAPTNARLTPLIHHFSKECKSRVDVRYADPKGRIHHLKSKDPRPPYSPERVLQDTCVSLNDVNQYKSALKITTADNVSFINVTEICLDHHYNLAETNLQQLIIQLNSDNQNIPFYVSHIISSNTVNTVPDYLFTTLTHADPDVIDESTLDRVKLIPKPYFGSEEGALYIHEPQTLQIPYKFETLRRFVMLSPLKAEDIRREATQLTEIAPDGHSVERAQSLLALEWESKSMAAKAKKSSTAKHRDGEKGKEKETSHKEETHTKQHRFFKPMEPKKTSIERRKEQGHSSRTAHINTMRTDY